MLWIPDRQAPSAWIEHVPFAFWLVDVLRPTSIVELGTYNGVSYSAFCQAVKTLSLSTSCFAIDTWKGDEHAGFYDEGVYREFAAFHDQRYAAFSRLVRSTFDEALTHFGDGSIDLLHIDGLHTYEAVRHDFENWFPKLSANAVVLFHDINVRENNFGVSKFWDELSSAHKDFHFNFLHGHGLGVLGIGLNYRSPLRLVFDANKNRTLAAGVRELFASFGRSTRLLYEQSLLEQEHSKLNVALSDRDAEVAALQKTLSPLDSELHQLRHALTDREAQLSSLQTTLADREAQLSSLQTTLADREAQLSSLQTTLADREAQLSSLQTTLADREAQLSSLQTTLADREAQLSSLQTTLADREAQLSSLQTTLADREAQLSSLQSTLADQEAQLSSLQTTLADQEAQLSSLRSTISALYASSSWKASAPLRAGKRLFEGVRMRLSALGRQRVPRSLVGKK